MTVEQPERRRESVGGLALEKEEQADLAADPLKRFRRGVLVAEDVKRFGLHAPKRDGGAWVGRTLLLSAAAVEEAQTSNDLRRTRRPPPEQGLPARPKFPAIRRC